MQYLKTFFIRTAEISLFLHLQMFKFLVPNQMPICFEAVEFSGESRSPGVTCRARRLNFSMKIISFMPEVKSTKSINPFNSPPVKLFHCINTVPKGVKLPGCNMVCSMPPIPAAIFSPSSTPDATWYIQC